MKKITSYLISMLLLIGVCLYPLSAMALSPAWTDGLSPKPGYGFGGGTGMSGDDPYLIGMASDLAQLAVNVNSGTNYYGKYFQLTADINLTGKEWIPIGTYDNPFKGHFTGDLHTVSNMSITRTNDYKGLFGSVENGTLSKIITSGSIKGSEDCYGGIAGGTVSTSVTYCVSTVSVTGDSQLGGLIGLCNDTIILSCSASGAVIGTAEFGGLIGRIGTSPDIMKSSASGDVTGIGGDSEKAGGFVGWGAESTFSECYATGKVTVEKFGAGGFAGLSTGCKFSKCYATGNVTAPSNAGGFTGADGAGTTYTNCYARGAVQVTGEYAGSFVGTIGADSVLSTVNNCYASGAVTGGTGFIGGFVGNPSGGTFTSCYYDVSKAGAKAAAVGVKGTSGITGLTTANMQGLDALTSTTKMATLATGSGANKWIPHDKDYPTIGTPPTPTPSPTNAPSPTPAPSTLPTSVPSTGEDVTQLMFFGIVALLSLGGIGLLAARRAVRRREN